MALLFIVLAGIGERYVATGTVTGLTSTPDGDACTVTSWGGHWDLPFAIRPDYNNGHFRRGDAVEVWRVGPHYVARRRQRGRGIIQG